MSLDDHQIGQKVADWHRDFKLNEELRFRYGTVSRYVRAQIRNLHEIEPAIRNKFPMVKDLERHAIKIGSAFMSAQRDRERRERQIDLDRRNSTAARKLRDHVEHLLKR